jgi:hypothetical protein
LEGNYRQEHVFALEQALELYDFYQRKIQECDAHLEAHLKSFEAHDPPPPTLPPQRKPQGNAPQFDLRGELARMLGTDLTAVDSLDALTVAKVVAEIGTDMSCFPSTKNFTSWLCLCPGLKKSGGRVLSSRTRPGANRAATALRHAAQTLYHSQSALGAYLRRMKSKLGAPAGITATAHKLARIIYAMLTKRCAYTDIGAAAEEERHRERTVKNLARKAKQFGFSLVSIPAAAAG